MSNILYIGDQNPSLGPVPLLRFDGSAVDLSAFVSMKFALRIDGDTTNVFGPSTAVMLNPGSSGVVDGFGAACWGVRYDFASTDLAAPAARLGRARGQWVGVDGSTPGKTEHYKAGVFELQKGY